MSKIKNSDLGRDLWFPPSSAVSNEFFLHESSCAGIRSYLKTEGCADISEKNASQYIVRVKKRLQFCRDTNTGFSLIRLGDGE